jgi:hypothetical protein
MINKKNLLGKVPEVIGDRDAIHTAIVSVRAASPIQPGTRCGLNENREARPDGKGVGVADPWRKKAIGTGESFWLLLNQDEVPNVQHHWEHPTVDFTAPTVEVKRNRTILAAAQEYGVTYEQVMAAAQYIVDHDEPMKYPGSLALPAIDVEEVNDNFDSYDFWSEWAGEALHDFPNDGTDCCPEYSYPDGGLFSSAKAEST